MQNTTIMNVENRQTMLNAISVTLHNIYPMTDKQWNTDSERKKNRSTERIRKIVVSGKNEHKASV